MSIKVIVKMCTSLKMMGVANQARHKDNWCKKHCPGQMETDIYNSDK